MSLQVLEAQVFRNILPNLTVPVLSSPFEFLQPEDQRLPQGLTVQDKVCRIFNEVEGAVRCESANGSRKFFESTAEKVIGN